MNDAIAERIEMRIAYLERSSTELSDVVYRQQREIDMLRTQLADLVSRADAPASPDPALTAAEEKPPHY